MRSTRTAVVALAAVLACTVPQKRKAIDATMQDAERRHESFEATLRVLDEHPEYVEEFFRLAQDRHPATLGRFLRATVSEIDHSPRLTEWTAAELARQPPALEKIMVATLEAADRREASRAAIAQAVGTRPKLAARALAERPDAALEVMKEMGAVGGGSLVHKLRGALGE